MRGSLVRQNSTGGNIPLPPSRARRAGDLPIDDCAGDTRPVPQRRLLTTTTGDPYPPVRLTYSIPSRSQVLRRLRRLRCVEIDKKRGRATVGLDHEARELDLDPPPPAWESLGQRIHLGAIQFPAERAMSLQVRSIRRAIELVRMLRPQLGSEVQLVRARLVNRWFEAAELTGEIDDLDRCLDRDVTVIDWEATADAFEKATAGAKDAEEYLRLAAEHRATRERQDVPLVEDFPLHAEDENDDMTDLANILNFRFLRAGRRWNGEEVTLRQVIEEAVAAHLAKLDSP